MLSTILAAHEGLGVSHRFPAISRTAGRISAVELATLCGLGSTAAALSAFLDPSLGIPGHNVIRVIVPMVLGLALVPRQGAGSVMGLSGLASAAVFSLAGARGIGAGAMTSLALTGVVLDLALLGARNGRSIYLRLATAGVAANMVAFLIRSGAKMFAAGKPGAMPFELWWPKALVTYPVCGAVAGLICAAVLFRATAGGKPEPDSEAPA